MIILLQKLMGMYILDIAFFATYLFKYEICCVVKSVNNIYFDHESNYFPFNSNSQIQGRTLSQI